MKKTTERTKQRTDSTGLQIYPEGASFIIASLCSLASSHEQMHNMTATEGILVSILYFLRLLNTVSTASSINYGICVSVRYISRLHMQLYFLHVACLTTKIWLKCERMSLSRGTGENHEDVQSE